MNNEKTAYLTYPFQDVWGKRYKGCSNCTGKTGRTGYANWPWDVRYCPYCGAHFIGKIENGEVKPYEFS